MESEDENEPLQFIRSQVPATGDNVAAVRKQTRIRSREPVAPRVIRLMENEQQFDAMQTLKGMEVRGMNYAQLMQVAPVVRRQICRSLLYQPLPKKVKPVPSETQMNIAAIARGELGESLVQNFYTTAIMQIGNDTFTVARCMLDAGSVISLASLSVLEKVGATIHPVHAKMSIRTATSAMTPIHFYADVNVTIAGITSKFRIFALPGNLNVSFGLLLGRRWLRTVKAIGDYGKDTYAIADGNGQYWEVPREGSTRGVMPAEIPQVHLMSTDGSYTELSDDTVADNDYDTDVKEVIRQSREPVNSGEESDDEWELGNGTDF